MRLQRPKQRRLRYLQACQCTSASPCKVQSAKILASSEVGKPNHRGTERALAEVRCRVVPTSRNASCFRKEVGVYAAARWAMTAESWQP
jgi:hypothetical protein